jgi:hypothetical protein
MQCRSLIARLKTSFRLCFVDGPFICPPHPSIISVYGDYGPFRRWLRWLPEHPEVDAETASSEIRYQLTQAMEEDDAKGATGEWVGLLGFSQGAKVSASLLFTQQKLVETLGRSAAGTNFRFGVILAGRAPLALLDSRVTVSSGVGDASQTSAEFKDWPDESSSDHLLRLPTIHVHGTRDPGLELHRRMLNQYCEEGTATLIEWDGDHRVPIKSHDVDAVSNAIIDLGNKLGLTQSTRS